jgi:hypothetical protein
MGKKEHLTMNGLHKIIALRLKASMGLGLSDALKKAFPSVEVSKMASVPCSNSVEPEVKDPN